MFKYVISVIALFVLLSIWATWFFYKFDRFEIAVINEKPSLKSIYLEDKFNLSSDVRDSTLGEVIYFMTFSNRYLLERVRNIDVDKDVHEVFLLVDGDARTNKSRDYYNYEIKIVKYNLVYNVVCHFKPGYYLIYKITGSKIIESYHWNGTG